MDENSVKTLLKDIADEPGPASAVDVAAARRRGRRRLRVRRVAAPALAVVAVAAAVTVPRAIISGAGERGVAAQPVPAVSASQPAKPRAMPRSAPSRFNPLVPYAAFGWLPAGFSEDAVSRDYSNAFTSSGTEVDRAAVQPSSSRMLNLTVYAKGTCAAPGPQPPAQDGPARPQAADPGSACLYSTGTAPDVNGRPAVWLGYGDGIAWEYAPGAWASVSAGFAPTGARSVSCAARQGWVLSEKSCASTRGTKGKRISGSQVAAAIRAGQLIPPSAATRALLVKVAGAVRYGQTAPVRFSFALTGPLPAGWRLTSTDFYVSGGRLLSTGLSAGPAADTSALGIGATPAYWPCGFVAGQSSYVTRYGVNWEYRVMTDNIAKNVRMLCSTRKVDGLQVSVYLDMAPEEAGAPPLPGSTQLGGAWGVYQKLRLLGANPAAWTTAPLG